MKNLSFALLAFFTILVLIDANKPKQPKPVYIHPKPLIHNSNGSTIYNIGDCTHNADGTLVNQKQELQVVLRTSDDSLIWKYVKRFEKVARREADLYNIPASIKLAQGIIEGMYGCSSLAKHYHNHFGIKAGKYWSGDRINMLTKEFKKAKKRMVKTKADFRAYESAWYSYRDHSILLSTSPYYRHLCTLQRYNYEGWAKGLQRAGYATDPNYAKKLISVIEKYQLYKI